MVNPSEVLEMLDNEYYTNKQKNQIYDIQYGNEEHLEIIQENWG